MRSSSAPQHRTSPRLRQCETPHDVLVRGTSRRLTLLRLALSALIPLGVIGSCASHAQSPPIPSGVGGVPASVKGDVRSSDLPNLPTRDDDCDQNELTDSLDIVRGYADDLNHNFVIDDCEQVAINGSYDPNFREWAERARAADTLTISRLFGPKIGYAIECFVPTGSGSARLVVRNARGEEVGVISECTPEGANLYYWPLRLRNGLLAEADKDYLLSLECRGRRLLRRARWGATFHLR